MKLPINRGSFTFIAPETSIFIRNHHDDFVRVMGKPEAKLDRRLDDTKRRGIFRWRQQVCGPPPTQRQEASS